MSHDSTAAPEAAARKLSGRRRKEIVAVLLFSGGPIFESSIPLSVFGIDRQDAGVPRYRLLVCAGEEGPLRTTGGLELTAPHGLEAISRAGTVVVPAWRSITSPPPEEALDALRRAHEEGARIVGLCTGAFVLAAAGLLDGRPATTHWMYAPTLAKRYPSVHVDPRELFVDDGDVLTSAGTAAGIDLCLHIVRTDHGNEAAGALARRLVVPPRRSGGQERYLDRSLPEEIGADPLAEVVAWALEHLHEQFDVETLAARVHEPADLRPPLPVTDGQRPAPVADHAARPAGTAPAGDVGLLGGRGGGPVRLPLTGRAARPLPPSAGFVPGRLPGGVPGAPAAGGTHAGARGPVAVPVRPAAARGALPDRPGPGSAPGLRGPDADPPHGGRGRLRPAAGEPAGAAQRSLTHEDRGRTPRGTGGRPPPVPSGCPAAPRGVRAHGTSAKRGVSLRVVA